MPRTARREHREAYIFGREAAAKVGQRNLQISPRTRVQVPR